MVQYKRSCLFYILNILLFFVFCSIAQAQLENADDASAEEETLRVDLSLYQSAKNGAQLVDTKIPIAHLSKLALVRELPLFDDIRSVLYADKNKVVLVNYTRNGDYIAHRIIAAADSYKPDSPVYSELDLETKTIELNYYNDFDNAYSHMYIEILADGQFRELLDGHWLIDEKETIAIVGCHRYGLDGKYPLNEDWVLISFDVKKARAVKTLRHWRDNFGSEITLIDEIFDKTVDNSPFFLLAFKGAYSAQDVAFITPKDENAKQSRRINDLIHSSEWIKHPMHEDGFVGPTSVEGNLHVQQVNEQLWMVFNKDKGDSVLLAVNAKGDVTMLLSSAYRYELFEVKNKRYLLVYSSGESTHYHVFEVVDDQLKHKISHSIVCC